MEEVDNIIVHTLRQIGCDLPDEVDSLKKFSTELIVEAAAKCLRVITERTDISPTLPPGMSAKFRVGTALANACTEIGYTGEIGYQTFLYSSETEIRKLLLFLIEKLPRDSSEGADEPLATSALLQRGIASEISRQLKGTWTPSYCKSRGVCWRGVKQKQWNREGVIGMRGYQSCVLSVPHGVGDLTKKIPKDVKQYYSKDLPIISDQPPHSDDLPASVLEYNAAAVTAAQEWENEWNSSGLASRLSEQDYRARKRQRLQKKITEQLRQGIQKSEAANAAASSMDLTDLLNSISEKGAGRTKGSRFTHAEKLQFTQDDEKAAAQMGIGEGAGKVDTEEELQRKREEEAQGLRDKLNELASQIEAMEIDMKKFNAASQQMEEQISTQGKSKSEKEDAYKVKKRTLDLLPDAENNILKLQAVVDSSAQRLVNLANQWEKHRAPLIDQYRELREANEGKVSESQRKLEEIKEFREKMKTVADEARGKDELLKQLMSEYERMTKDVNRSAYTRRILEIVANIRKQKNDIDKILIDTKSLQKEINQLTGKLDRTFTVTDELIFRDAKKDEAVRKAYKYLAALHENCSLLVKTVEETGSIKREIRDLEDQIDSESNSKTSANLAKITADYKQMKKENDSLMAKLKGKA
ncbi:coiled-coil domain-containing protein 22 homolog [Ptychodera flava]|uniref:coiled-coil domain-containing protein 22 homolog n=1 Tax=Ptychodera flava TaxID=63121 RepID=UPI00396A8F54